MESILKLTGQRNNYVSGDNLKFPSGYLIDSQGKSWEIVNPQAGHNEVLVKQLGADETKLIGLSEEVFDRFVRFSDSEGMASLLKRRFRG
jgi:hypothetical protein